MLTSHNPNPSYQVGGSLPFNAPTYVRRQADEALFQGLLRGEFCYVFNARQMGKSSTSSGEIPADNSPEQTELILTGLVEKRVERDDSLLCKNIP
jgi:bacillopeptidase F (M6 metalloprotease family)